MSLTVLLLNYTRPENIRRIVSALKEQTHKPIIFLWNNGSPIYCFHKGAELGTLIGSIDWQIESSVNRYCSPRWLMAQQAETKYVMALDDDLLPAPDLCETVVAELERASAYRIIGAFGKDLNPEAKYEQCPSVERGSACDIVLGRCMALRTEAVQAVRFPFHDPLLQTTDDIFLSGTLRRYSSLRKPHYCSTVFNERLEELPDDGALCKQEGHFELREQARRRWCLR